MDVCVYLCEHWCRIYVCVCVCIFESKAKLRQNNKIFTALTKVLCKIWQINYEIALKCRVRGKERGRADMSVRVCTWNSFENERKINKVNCINILHLTFYIHTSVQLYVCISVCVVHREREKQQTYHLTLLLLLLLLLLALLLRRRRRRNSWELVGRQQQQQQQQHTHNSFNSFPFPRVPLLSSQFTFSSISRSLSPSLFLSPFCCCCCFVLTTDKRQQQHKQKSYVFSCCCSTACLRLL